MNFSDYNHNKSNNKRQSQVIVLFVLGIVLLGVGYVSKELYTSIVSSANDYKKDIVPIRYIKAAELLPKMNSEETMKIDVRAKTDYDWEHLKGFVSIPLDELSTYHSKINKNKEIVVFCNSSDCNYSKIASRRLYKAGFKNVKILSDNILNLKLSGFESVKSGKAKLMDDVYKVQELTKEELEKLIKNKSPVDIVDLRSKEAFNKFHFATSYWKDKKVFKEDYKNISKLKNVVLIVDEYQTAIDFGSLLYDSGFYGVKFYLYIE